MSAPRFPVERWRLVNGLTVVVQVDRRWPLVALAASYDAGARRDPPARAGLAHLCEHLAFYGPRSGSGSGSGRSFPGRIESVGGLAQAVTLPDRICFSAVFPRAALADVLAVEAERMACPLDSQDAEAFEIQRRVVIEELHERSQSRTLAVAFEQLHRLLFPAGHPYHRPAAGEPDEVGGIALADVEGFAASHFTPRDATLTIVGDVGVTEVAGLVSRFFERVPAGAARGSDGGENSTNSSDRSNRSDSGGLEAQSPNDGRFARVPAAVPGAQVHVAWSVPGFGRPESYLAALLMRGIAAGRSSPLARPLLESARLARDVRWAIITQRSASTLVLMAYAGPGVETRRLEEGLVKATDRVLADGLSAATLARARKKALSDHYFLVQSLERRADLCASLSCYLGEPERLESEAQRYEEADPHAIAAFASDLRQSAARATLSLIPRAEAA